MAHSRAEDENQPMHENQAELEPMTAADATMLEGAQHPNMQDMARAGLGTEAVDLSMLSTNSMGFYQFDSFESDLLIAFASGDAQFGLPEMGTATMDKSRRPAM